MRAGLSLLIMFMALSLSAAIVADHESVVAFEDVPESYFESIRQDYSFFYGHTSHGSQIMTGLGMLQAEDVTLFQVPSFHEISDDLGHNGDTSWVQPTRDWLDDHPECNAVMWSWCGGCSDNTEAGINDYLNAMSELELEYPTKLFIYMTGHLDGGGPDGNLYARNNQIRAYCLTEDKVLFDFADIESWDPEGNWYPYESDACNWCTDWCAEFTCPDCGDCAHSHCFNCYQKGKGFWWMMARVAGWEPTGIHDTPIPSMHMSQNYPNPFNPSTEICVQVEQSGHASLAVFDLAGRRLATLHEGQLNSGRHVFVWEGKHESSGVYLYRLFTAEEVHSLKMVLVK
ncbi:T9SS type A sorting domain-containing protein [bacterium]|nr:T9SS type A sorting domain-containing protein [bacterium]